MKYLAVGRNLVEHDEHCMYVGVDVVDDDAVSPTRCDTLREDVDSDSADDAGRLVAVGAARVEDEDDDSGVDDDDASVDDGVDEGVDEGDTCVDDDCVSDGDDVCVAAV